ncbi:LOW QUALITY PROTEIN: synaptonemal complex protein 2 [Microcaecilia unicolor]|uniref:LOW QUALITY PROTEIN: synaptonemal complex protein 2 n=1 Tax=Microcaecilia unicolor TaxID=1415580 RepID=A0A6P7Z0N6_9AMPH|nr:LOW QUALITY PROTEIN: synaptonemal complex protein 2 [Microcaecilia unicolor]
MPVRQELQLEKYIDEASRKNDFQQLEDFLQNENCDVSQKCSKQFFNKLNKLICRELDKKEIRNVSILMNSLQKYGKNIIMHGEDGLTAMIKQGLVQKMVTWFEKIKEILICGQRNEKNETLINLVEDFFDVIMVVHDVSNDGKMQVLENFVSRTCSLVADLRMNVFIQQEAIRKLNVMLDSMPREVRKKILCTKELMPMMNDMGKRILNAGDYDLQVAITEALCRMTSEKQRGELSSQWFPMEFVTNAFKGIKDSDFETDCRKFLNQVNGMLGEKRRVFTYPCLSVFLDKYELQVPSDEKLEEFWIDFNIGSQSISFYVAADDGDDHQWETVSIPEEEVENYSVEALDMKQLLTVILRNSITVGCREGRKILIYFDSALDILEVAKKVYDTNKYKGFTKKNAISVAKTAVHIIFDESGSQILVPESQVIPPSVQEKSIVENGEQPTIINQPPVSTMDQNNTSGQLKGKDIPCKVTPSKTKMSEASMVIPGAGGLTLRSPVLIARTSTPQKGRIKPPLEMVNSAEPRMRTSEVEGYIQKQNYVGTKKNNLAPQNKQISAAEVVEMVQNEEHVKDSQKEYVDDQESIVPDSQLVENKEKPLLPGLTERSFDDQKACTNKASLVAEKCTSSYVRQKISSVSSELTFHTNHIFSDRIVKQQAFYSIFEGSGSPEQTKKPQNRGGRTAAKQQQMEKNEDVQTCAGKRPCKPLTIRDAEKQTLKNSKVTGLSIETESPSTSVYQTGAVEKSMQSSKKLLLDKDVVHDCGNGDGTPCRSRTNTNHQKSQKTRTSEFLLTGPETKKLRASFKEKEHTDAGETMISKIGKKYIGKNTVKYDGQSRNSLTMERSYINKFENKDKVQDRRLSHLKAAEDFMDDVYSFNLSGTEEPTIKLGVQELSTTKQKSSLGLTSKMNPDGSKSEIKKNEEKKPRTHNSRKHLFSDTDTDKCDDSKTDISWLQGSNKKEKPKLLGYSRQRVMKKPGTVKDAKFPELCQPKCRPEETRKIDKVTAQKSPKASTTRAKCPRRAAAKAKSYKDLSNSEAESEEQPAKPLPVRKETFIEQVEYKIVSTKFEEKQKKAQGVVPKELKKGKKNKELMITDPRDPVKDEKMLSPLVSSPLTPGSIEQMRFAESYLEPSKCANMSRTSSPLPDSSPDKSKSFQIKSGISTGNFYSNVAKNQNMKLTNFTENSLRKMFRKEDSSPVLSASLTPSLSPVTVTLDKSGMSGKDSDLNVPKFSVQELEGDPLNINNYLSGKQSDELECKIARGKKTEKISPSSRESISSVNKEQPWTKIPDSDVHVSGPSMRIKDAANLKRMYRNCSESDSEENDIESQEQNKAVDRKAALHPRKLFKASNKENVTYRVVSESLSTISVNDICLTEGDAWEAGSSDVGLVCQKISEEFTRKIQNRSRKLDCFTKQSLKSAQQHLASMSIQIHESRVKRLDSFQVTILQELQNFEKDAQFLKNMEKEFSNVMKQQIHMFCAYQRSEQQRIHHLKSSFEKNIFNSIDYEENIFTSEMHLMREDMKTVQERLLKEMQEEELLNSQGPAVAFYDRKQKALILVICDAVSAFMKKIV